MLPATIRLNIHKSVNLRLFDRIDTDPNAISFNNQYHYY